MNATQLVEEARKRLSQTDEAIRAHPYMAALADGSASRRGIEPLPGHQYHIVVSGIRSDAAFLRRFGDTVARDFFRNLLEGELAAFDNLLVMASHLDMTEANLRDYEPSAEGFAYAAYVAWLSDYGSAAEVAGGFLVNLAAWGRSCGEVSRSLRKHYGFRTEHTTFLDRFAELPPLDDVALPIIQDGLDQGVAPQAILRAARLFQAYEQMFWDAMAECARFSPEASTARAVPRAKR